MPFYRDGNYHHLLPVCVKSHKYCSTDPNPKSDTEVCPIIYEKNAPNLTEPYGGIQMGRNKKYKRSVYQSLAVITQFGINMLVPIFNRSQIIEKGILRLSMGITIWKI